MKRTVLVLILFAVLCISGCDSRNYNILDYQSKNIMAECLINNKYKVALTKNESGCTLTVLEPEEAKDISFEIGEESVYAVSKDVRIQMEKESLGGICAIGGMFSQTEECMISATEQGKESVLTFETDACMYRITLGENSVPKHVKITSESFEYDIKICSIELT